MIYKMKRKRWAKFKNSAVSTLFWIYVIQLKISQQKISEDSTIGKARSLRMNLRNKKKKKKEKKKKKIQQNGQNGKIWFKQHTYFQIITLKQFFYAKRTDGNTMGEIILFKIFRALNLAQLKQKPFYLV